VSIIDRALIEAQYRAQMAAQGLRDSWFDGWRSARRPVLLATKLVASRLQWKHIGDATETPMLTRYWIGSVLGWTAVLHEWHRADEYIHPHNHPWRNAISFVLCGEYEEQRVTFVSRDAFRLAMMDRRAGSASIIGSEVFHVVTRVEPETWSLFLHGPKVRPWGFLTQASPKSFVFADTYFKAWKNLFRSREK
jgi:hypothetical protein